MKKRFSFVFIAASLITIPTSYAAATDDAASTRAPQMETKIAAPSWLENQGLLSAAQVLELLGTQATPSQRAQIEDAVKARNAAIQKANAQLSAQLGAILKTDDAALAHNVADKKAARELNLIRIQQPARYQAMMRNKNAQKK